jgi:hypothetical protein
MNGWACAIRFASGLVALGAMCHSGIAQEKRAIQVADAIAMTRLADPLYFQGFPSTGKVGNYSQDGHRFVVVLRRGDITTDTNAYSIYLFEAHDIFNSHGSKLLLTMSSSSNRPAISEVRWLADNRTLAFLGASQNSISQIYTLNISTHRLVQRTRHATAIEQFEISGDGAEVLFTAEPTAPLLKITARQRHEGVLIKNQSLGDLLAGHFNEESSTSGVFLKRGSEQEIHIPSTHLVTKSSRLSLSPNGQYALLTVYFREPQLDWSKYDDYLLKLYASRPWNMGNDSVIHQLFLVDCKRGYMTPLLDAPAIYPVEPVWAADSQSVFVKTFLPLDGVTASERAERAKSVLPSRIAVPSKRIERLSQTEWDRTLLVPKQDTISISLEEDPNTPPKIVARDQNGHNRTVLLDLNPQFASLDLGRVEKVPFTVHGISMEAALYLPPDYRPGKRYPLVIQTHGYDAERFSMDGLEEWSSGFAARPLAATGILVVQTQRFVDPKDHDRIGADRTLGTTPEQSFRNFMSLVYTQVIEELDKRGMIDASDVGISGFSRTVWFVAYTITHSDRRFRAVLLTDGIDGGYFRYIANRETEFEVDNGGLAPFGKPGLNLWMDQAPGFNLDRIQMPVRLVCFREPTTLWEAFIGLQLQNKPVELIELPDAEHLLERPSDRKAAMQGMVDWFRFWLQDYEDPDMAKAEQYKRWEKLRELRDADAKGLTEQTTSSAPH